MQIFDFLIRLSSALLLGTLVGLERQWRQRMAGTGAHTAQPYIAAKRGH
jgi:uncharacterized membrane protein YhiD involved in acid resistance